MEVDLQDVFEDNEAAERLLPLFQLLIFLEELALETEDYPQRQYDFYEMWTRNFNSRHDFEPKFIVISKINFV